MTTGGRAATDRMLETAGAAVVVALLGYALLVWPSLPARVPIHFGLSGPPDGWAPRGALAILPGAALFTYVSITLAQRRGAYNFPVRVTPENAEQLRALARRLMTELKLVITGICGYLFWLCAAIARGRATGLPVWFAPAVVVVLVALLATTFVRMKRC
jgi:uncharacterized membrane protein